MCEKEFCANLHTPVVCILKQIGRILGEVNQDDKSLFHVTSQFSVQFFRLLECREYLIHPSLSIGQNDQDVISLYNRGSIWSNELITTPDHRDNCGFRSEEHTSELQS